MLILLQTWLNIGFVTEETRKIVPITENKQLVESKTSTGYSGVYNLNFTVDDIVRDYSVSTPLGVNLIVMGTVQAMGPVACVPQTLSSELYCGTLLWNGMKLLFWIWRQA